MIGPPAADPAASERRAGRALPLREARDSPSSGADASDLTAAAATV